MKTKLWILICLALWMAAAGCAQGPTDTGVDAVLAEPSPVQSVHAEFLELHRDTQPSFETFAPTVPLSKRSTKALYEKFGFYPYWVSTPVDELPYGSLTTIGFFSIEINQYGNLTNLHGWPHGQLVNEAHTHGTRVVVTVTNFSGSQLQTLLGSASYRSTAIGNIVAQVVAGGADGVNIDFEGVPLSAKANFVTFMAELSDALEAVLFNPHITVDMPAIDWAGSYDYDQLAAQCDYLWIMAYGYHYSGGDPGPVSPLYAGGIWPGWAGIDYTLDDYETYLSPYTLRKVVLGLPLYGHDWPTVSDQVPGTTRGKATSVTWANALAMEQSGAYGPRHFDAGSKTPYLVYYDGGWRQLWYGDSWFLLRRFLYGMGRNVGGVGFWALGYTDTQVLESALSEAFGND